MSRYTSPAVHPSKPRSTYCHNLFATYFLPHTLLATYSRPLHTPYLLPPYRLRTTHFLPAHCPAHCPTHHPLPIHHLPTAKPLFFTCRLSKTGGTIFVLLGEVTTVPLGDRSLPDRVPACRVLHTRVHHPQPARRARQGSHLPSPHFPHLPAHTAHLLCAHLLCTYLLCTPCLPTCFFTLLPHIVLLKLYFCSPTASHLPTVPPGGHEPRQAAHPTVPFDRNCILAHPSRSSSGAPAIATPSSSVAATAAPSTTASNHFRQQGPASNHFRQQGPSPRICPRRAC